jgi:hypothetical protein
MDLLSHPCTPLPYVAFFRRSHKGFEAFTGKTCWSDGATSVWNLLFPLLRDASVRKTKIINPMKVPTRLIFVSRKIHGTVTPPE